MDHDRDDFNSSDIEFEERPNPFFAAGMSSIEAIMDHAVLLGRPPLGLVVVTDSLLVIF